MIRQIDNTEVTQATRQPAAQRQVGPATPAGKTFASVLQREKTADAAPTRGEKLPITAPPGEVWRPVAGDDHYAKIIDGPRAGQYVNLSRGERRGEVFSVEVRDGKRVHVYGDGDDQKVIEAAKDSGKVRAGKDGRDDSPGAARRVPRREQWAPVEGANNYADILSGPRNGYYVNTSGGERDGMAFQIVRRGERTYHIYGKGENRQVVEVNSKKTDEARNDNAANGGTDVSETRPDRGPRRGNGTGGAAASD